MPLGGHSGGQGGGGGSGGQAGGAGAGTGGAGGAGGAGGDSSHRALPQVDGEEGDVDMLPPILLPAEPSTLPAPAAAARGGVWGGGGAEAVLGAAGTNNAATAGGVNSATAIGAPNNGASSAGVNSNGSSVNGSATEAGKGAKAESEASQNSNLFAMIGGVPITRQSLKDLLHANFGSFEKVPSSTTHRATKTF